jgi:hypothetical protein
MLTAACSPSSSAASGTPSPTLAAASPAPAPVIDASSALSWDGVDGRVMLVSQVLDRAIQHTSLRAWTFTGTKWQPAVAPPVAPVQLGFRSLFLAFDTDHDREIFVSTPEIGTDVETWEWDGHNWKQIITPHTARGLSRGAYSPELHALVGWDGTTYWYDTWVYDGTDWRSIRTTATPFASNMPTVDYDPVRHSVVALNTIDYSTWLWSGSDWSALPLGGPTPATGGGFGRQNPGVGFDPSRELWLVQGGAGFDRDMQSDTSTGDGTSWKEARPSVSPGPRLGSRLTWDPPHQRLLLFGGLRDVNQVLDDAWAWKGGNWAQLSGPVVPAPTPPPCTPGSGYGVLIAAGNLQLVNTCGSVAASTPISASSVQTCSTSGGLAVMEPPVSATHDLVFFRDGDTKIRSLTLAGHTADVTTVPGGPGIASFFSVSPDDQRIAVAVQDFSASDTIKLRLYVEDLHGGGHHLDIYTASVAKTGGTTVWPMGWHDGSLVLAVMPACSPSLVGLSPVAWHVVDAATANRQASIDASSCGTLSMWPSPAGVLCGQPNGTGVYGWSGREVVGINSGPCVLGENGLSPSGARYFYSSSSAGCGGQPAGSFTRIEGGSSNEAGGGDTPWHAACLWIDNDHLLAPDSVITASSGQYVPAQVKLLPVVGTCAGRFPGDL